MKILIVEDEITLARVLGEKFEREGFKVKLIYDGEAAVETVRNFKPEVVLLDLLLPKKDGFEVLKEIQADAELKHIPVIVLSNLGEDEEIKRAFSLGAADYYVKVQHMLKEVVEKVKARVIKPEPRSRPKPKK